MNVELQLICLKNYDQRKTDWCYYKKEIEGEGGWDSADLLHKKHLGK